MSTFRDKSKVTIRRATIEDLDSIVALIKEIPEEINLKEVMKTDVQKGKEILREILESKGAALVSTYFQEGFGPIIVGTMVLGEGNIWFSDKKFFTNVVLYVKPAYRHLGIQRDFLVTAQEFANNLKCDLLIDFLNTTNLEVHSRFFRFLGFKPIGMQFIYRGE